MKQFAKKQLISLILILTMIFVFTPFGIFVSDVYSFDDVPIGTWYYDSVKNVSDKGIITGYNATTFGPFDNLKREQLVNILWRIDGKPYAAELENNFTDILPFEWYTDAIKWANANGIVKGYGGTTLFGRGDNILRQDLAIMLANFAKYKGRYIEPTTTLDKFADKEKVSSYAVEALQWATENGILSGNANADGTRTIAPLKNAKRCEAAVMLTRFCENIFDIKNPNLEKLNWISDVPLSEIKCIKDNGMMNIQPKMFITKSGELYEFSTEKKYSNEQVCKKINTNVLFDRFHLFANDRDLSLIISTDNQYYYYEKGEFKDYFIDDISIRQINELHPNNYGYWQMGYNSYDIYYYIENNNIYEYKLEYYLDEETFDYKQRLVSDTLIDTIPDGEEFVSLDGRIIKTNKSFYKLGIKNKDQCDQYEDVEPIFGLVKLSDVSKEYNNIEYFNGNYIIYKDDPKNLYIYYPYFY